MLVDGLGAMFRRLVAVCAAIRSDCLVCLGMLPSLNIPAGARPVSLSRCRMACRTDRSLLHSLLRTLLERSGPFNGCAARPDGTQTVWRERCAALADARPVSLLG